MDQTLRDLERRAQAGDVDAANQLAAARSRAGFNSVDAEYLQKLLSLLEQALKLGQRHHDELKFDEESEDYVLPEQDDLDELNEWAKSAGVSPTLIREEFPGTDAFLATGAWYNSSAHC